MPVREILQLGDPRLLERCASVAEHELGEALAVARDLLDTMRDFRARHGWGRAIAAPQLGVLKRIVVVELDAPWLLIDPVASAPSDDMLELWDDCMSFPDLLVRVRRHVAFDLAWRDEEWVERRVRVEGPMSELLQHELDHLGGVLAVSRAVDGHAFALQSQRARLGAHGFANPANPRGGAGG